MPQAAPASWPLLFLFSVTYLWLWLPVTASAQSPVLLWTSSPAAPNDTALAYGSGLNSTSSVEVCRRASPTVTNCSTLAALQWWDYSVKFRIPESWPLSVYQFKLCSASGSGPCSASYLLNAAEVAWVHGDAGSAGSTPGGDLRLFGRSLAFARGECVSSATPTTTTGTVVKLTSIANPLRSYAFGRGSDGRVIASCQDIRVSLPTTLPTGSYYVSVANALQIAAGFDASNATRDGDPLTIDVVHAKVWPGDRGFNNTDRVLDVRKDYNGSVSQAVAAANAIPGGAVVYVSAGPDILMGDREYVTLGRNVVLRGDGANVSRLVWANNSAVIMPTTRLIKSANGSIKIEDIGFEVTSTYQKGFLGIVNASGSVVQRIAIRINTQMPLNNALYVDSNDVTIADSYVSVQGDPYTQTSYPQQYMLWANNAQYFRLLRVRWDTNCPGYAITGGAWFLWEGNQFTSYKGPFNSSVSGSGFNTLFGYPRSERVGFVRNCQRDNLETHYMESWTGDGPGGAYWGTIRSLNGTSLELTSNASLSRTLPGQVAIFTNGQGAGQLGRIAGYTSNTSMILERPLAVPVEPGALVSITAYRGDIIISGNLFEEGSMVQSYGMQMMSVWSYNTMRRMLGIPWQSNNGQGGFNLHGREYQGGVEPAYFNEIHHNRLINCSGGITTITSASNKLSGPFIRAIVIRHNVIQLTGLITVATNVSDAVVEHNRVNSTAAAGPVSVSNGADHVIVQNNVAGAEGLPDPYGTIARPCAYVTPAPSPSSSSAASRTQAAALLLLRWLVCLLC